MRNTWDYLVYTQSNYNKPTVRMIIMILVTVFGTLILNWGKRTSLISNMDYIVFLIMMFSGALLMNRYIHA